MDQSVGQIYREYTKLEEENYVEGEVPTLFKLLEYEDVLVQHVLTYLNIPDLYNCARTCSNLYRLIFNESYSSSSWIFKHLLINTLTNVCSGESSDAARQKIEKQIMVDYNQMAFPSWLSLLKEYILIKFDSNYSLGTCKHTLLSFRDNDTVAKTTIGNNVWESVCSSLPMREGRIYRWKFIVESWEATGNTYELVVGCTIQDKTFPNFNGDHDIVYLRDYNAGIGFNLGLWKWRIGTEHVAIEKPEMQAPCPLGEYSKMVPFSIGCIFDYTKHIPVLHIYFQNKKVAHVEADRDMLERISNRVFYATVSMCRRKTVRIAPWI
jgi:hypothetical protein